MRYLILFLLLSPLAIKAQTPLVVLSSNQEVEVRPIKLNLPSETELSAATPKRKGKALMIVGLSTMALGVAGVVVSTELNYYTPLVDLNAGYLDWLTTEQTLVAAASTAFIVNGTGLTFTGFMKYIKSRPKK